MWPQIVKSRMKPGAEDELAGVRDELMARVRQRLGLVHALWMQNQNDPQEYYTVVVFESEEQACEGERLLEQRELFQRLRSLTEGTPDYVDLTVMRSDVTRTPQ